MAPASAHAELLSTTPTNGARLDAAPDSIELVWAEHVSRATVRLIDEEGQELPGVTQLDVTRLASRIVFIPSQPLERGSWAVSWYVTGMDGHLVNGAFAFSVGEPLNPKVLDAVAGNSWLWDRLLASTGWIGIMVSLGALWARRRYVGIAAALLALEAEAVLLARVAAIDDGNPLLVGEGRAALFVALAALVLLNGNARRRQDDHDPTATALVAILWYALQAVASGHQLDLSGWIGTVTTLALAAHLAASLVWVAAVLALLMRTTAEQARQTSRMATRAIAVLLPAGAITALALVLPLPDSPTTWLLSLASKLLLVGVALALGVFNHQRLARSADATTLTVVRRFVMVEAAVMLAVIGATIGLTSSAAPATSVAEEATEEVVDGPMAKVVRFDNGLFATVRHDIANTGTRMRWELGMSPVDGQPVPLTDLRVTAAAQGEDTVAVPVSGAGAAWRGSALLPTAGYWTFTFTARLSDGAVMVARAVIEAR